MKRYEHFLPVARPSAWPDCVLCLSASVNWLSTPNETRRQYVQLERWNITALVRQADGYAVAREATGTTSNAFWEAIKTVSLRWRKPWIISTEFRQLAAAVDLWERMEAGYVRISGSDPLSSSRRVDYLSNLRGNHKGGVDGTAASVGRNSVRLLPKSVPETQRSSSGRHRTARNCTGGICVVQDPPVIMQLRIDGGGSKITWVDAANYGIDRMSEGLDNHTVAQSLGDWFIRAASTLQSLGKVGWQHTAASQAMHLFRSIYHETPILSNTHPAARSLESSALFGGRCECYYRGQLSGSYHMYDIRSLYPYLCAHRTVPVALGRVVDWSEKAGRDAVDMVTTGICEPIQSSIQYRRLVDGIINPIWIAEVDIETNEPDYPYRLLPDEEIFIGGQRVTAKTIYGNQPAVVYPTGRFTTCLADTELCHALRSGSVRRLRRAAIYKGSCALKRYAESLYRIRCVCDRDGNTALGDYIKRLMVALPGKFAQRYAQWHDAPDVILPSSWGEYWFHEPSGRTVRYRAIAGQNQIEETGGFTHGACPAITAAICAAGRHRLLDCIRTAGFQSTYYCDTDAIIVDTGGRERLIAAGWVRPGEWGYLQHVVSAEGCEIYGVKHYRIGTRSRCSGDKGTRGPIMPHGEPVSIQPSPADSIRQRERPANWRGTVSSSSGRAEKVTENARQGLLLIVVTQEWKRG